MLDGKETKRKMNQIKGSLEGTVIALRTTESQIAKLEEQRATLRAAAARLSNELGDIRRNLTAEVTDRVFADIAQTFGIDQCFVELGADFEVEALHIAVADLVAALVPSEDF